MQIKIGWLGGRNRRGKIYKGFLAEFFVMLEEKRASHDVSVLAYHIFWIPKYRRRIPVGPVTAALRELIEAKASEMGWRIVAQKIMPDHIHLFIQADAKISPSSIVRLLKGFTSRRLGKRFPYLRRRGIFGRRAAGYQLLAMCLQRL